MKIMLRFRCWRFYRLFFFREVLPFYIWFYPPLLDYDVSLHNLVELVRCDSNEPKIIEIGVRMQKLLSFSYCCFCQFSGGRKFRSSGPEYPARQFPALAG